MSIAEILSIEPQLKAIADAAANASRDRLDEAYCSAKAQAEGFVGWDARRPELRSTGVYNQFISYLCERMGF